MQKEKRSVLVAIESYVDMIINFISLFSGYLLALVCDSDEKVFNILHPYTIGTLFLSLILSSLVYHAMNLYSTDRYSGARRSFGPVFFANCVYFGFVSVIALIFSVAEHRRFLLIWMFFSAILSTVYLASKRQFIKCIIRTWRSKQCNLKKVIIVGDNTHAAADYVREISSDCDNMTVVMGYVGDKINTNEIGIEWLGQLSDFERILDRYRPTDAVIAINSYDKLSLIRIVNICDDRCVRVSVLPIIYDFLKNSSQIVQVGSVPMLSIHTTPLDNPKNAAKKRLFDIVASVILIFITAPIMLFAAVGVYFSSPGPIIFKQKRVGRHGKMFNMLKFRSMRVNQSSNTAWTTANDTRKTRFGAFMRRTSIDELPQLFNVLFGNMSLVGPRPEIPVYVKYFKDTVPLYMIKHYVKPGITGLAQIKGFRGDTSIEGRIREDIRYIENWSFWLDLNILFKTPFKAFNKNEKYTETAHTGEGGGDSLDCPFKKHKKR